MSPTTERVIKTDIDLSISKQPQHLKGSAVCRVCERCIKFMRASTCSRFPQSTNAQMPTKEPKLRLVLEFEE